MIMKIMLVDVYKEKTRVHFVGTENGEYKARTIYGNSKEQADKLMDFYLKRRPDRVIFDINGIGKVVKDAFKFKCESYGFKYMDRGTVKEVV